MWSKEFILTSSYLNPYLLPSYAKLLKEMLLKKGRLDECKTIASNKEYGDIILNKLQELESKR